MKIEGRDGLKSMSDADATRILFVTHLPGALADEEAVRFGPGIRIVQFDAIGRDLIETYDPHFVVSAILTPRFDILDLAQRLTELKFKGAYRVLTDSPLPNPGVVLREVRSQCPRLDVDLLSMDMLRR